MYACTDPKRNSVINPSHLKEVMQKLTHSDNVEIMDVSQTHRNLATPCWTYKHGSYSHNPKTSLQKKVTAKWCLIDMNEWNGMFNRYQCVIAKHFGKEYEVKNEDWLWSRDDNLDWSHLCHNGKRGCCNPEHGIMEPSVMNQKRKQCGWSSECVYYDVTTNQKWISTDD